MSEIPANLSYTAEHEWIASGEIVEVNSLLETTPETLGEDPYGNGWLFKIKSEAGEYELLDADGYRTLIQS